MVHFSALCAPQWPSQSAFRQCSQAQFHHWLYFDLIFMFQPESRLEVTIVLTNTVPFGPNGCSFGLNSSISHLTVFSYDFFYYGWVSYFAFCALVCSHAWKNSSLYSNMVSVCCPGNLSSVVMVQHPSQQLCLFSVCSAWSDEAPFWLENFLWPVSQGFWAQCSKSRKCNY